MLIQLPIILFSSLVLAYVAKIVLKRLTKQPRLYDSVSTFLQALSGITTSFIIGYGLILCFRLANDYYQLPFKDEHINQMRELFLVLMLTWFLFSWKNKHEALLINKKENLSLVAGISKFLTLLLIIGATLLILGILKINYTALLAFGGLGGLAISWAAKDVIANFFGGLMIHINRPFSIGDWIKSSNKNFEGIVEHIGWYMTQIRSLDRRPTYIPNALITDAIIENPGRMTYRGIRATLGLRYQDYPLVKAIIEDVRQMLQGHPEISKSQPLMVHLIDFNESSIDIEINCFTRKTQTNEFRNVQQELLFKIADLINARGAELAYPTHTIYLNPSSQQAKL